MTGIQRRVLLASFGGAGLAFALGRGWANPASGEGQFADSLARLESGSGGRLGVAFLDGKTGVLLGHRQDARFTLCSTFKFSLAAAVLARIDAGTLRGSMPVTLSERDIVGHSPVVQAALPQGALSIAALAEAAQVQSDNAAANLLLRQIGGPEALTRFWRALGDDVSWLDRYEPDLNTSEGDDQRDTSTPAAMARTMAAILTGDVLKPASRDRLVGWMVATKTGAARLRAGLPQGFRAGDKTGTYASEDGRIVKVNDIAAFWRADGTPCFLTAFYEPPSGMAVTEREAVLARVGAIAAAL
ncbi:class A beta-lactamase [Sphingobium sufflavum]|uniref:class A beta-lactamase n=1 Tax=Sphingobium sufflavum TaxID=1129547 RepID=UPI001EFF15FA|nr:class A beta-lactamase [Sphingobium sufflavum]MCE7794954.1 class A beta-lactamase [Sphingobium sufflavum]